MFNYNVPSDFVSSSNSGTGSGVSNENSMAKVESGTDSDGTASITSKGTVQYVSGHETQVLFAAMFETQVADSTQWIGAFDPNDGFAVGCNGTSFAILHRDSLDSPNEIITNSSAFNVDRLDGQGPSGIQISLDKLNVFRISYGWLGAAPIRFSILRADGKWFDFHRTARPNSASVPNVSNPVLPICAQVTNTGNTSNLILRSASWSACTVGDNPKSILRNFNYSLIDTTIGPTTPPLFTIRNKTTYQSKTNRIITKALFLIVGARAGNANTQFQLVKNATLSGGSDVWVDQDTNLSTIEVNTDATGYTGGTELFKTFVVNKEARSHFLLKNDIIIVLYPGETLTFAATTDGNYGVDAALLWQET